jgi:hypothetical protein
VISSVRRTGRPVGTLPLALALLLSLAAGASPSRAAAPDGEASAADCAERLVRQAKLAIDEAASAGSAPRSGQALPLRWDAGAAGAGCGGGAWLILATPERVRFSGEGFFALAPGERAPADIGFAADRMRAIVPLHLDGNASGGLSVEPYLIGDLQIDWALAYAPAGAVLASDAVVRPLDPIRTTVAPGVPRVIIQDPYSTDAPVDVVVSNSGAFRLEIFDGHYRVLDETTGALVWAAEGLEPRFSPSSRFLHAFGKEKHETAEMEDSDYADLRSVLTVIDLYAEKPVLQLGADGSAFRGRFIQGLEWSPGDAFLAVVYEAWSAVGFQQMLIDRPYHYAQYGCGNCSLYDSGSVSISPEAASASIGGVAGRTRLSLAFPETIGRAAGDPETSGLDTVLPQAGLLRAFSHERLSAWSARRGGSERSAIDLNGIGRASFRADGASPVAVHTRPDERRSERFAGDWAMLDNLQHRGARSLSARSSKAFGSRMTRRLADLGVEYMSPPPLFHDHVETLLPEERPLRRLPAGWGDAAFFETGGLARARGLATADVAERIDALSLPLAAVGNEVLLGYLQDIQVWTLKHRGEVVQFIQYLQIHGSRGVPDGLIAAVRADEAGGSRSILALQADYMPDDLDELGLGETARAELEARATSIAITPAFGVRLFRLSEDLVAFLDPQRRLVVVDMSKAYAQTVFADIEGADDVNTIGMTRDGRHLVQLNSDGRFFILGLDTGKIALSGLYLDDEAVIYDEGLRYVSTDEGARYVNLKFPGDRNLYSLDQLSAGLRRDGLVQDRLAGRFQPIAAPVVPVPPRLLVEAAGSSDGGTDIVRIRAEAVNGLAAITVHRDGVPIRSVPISGARADITLDLPVLPETRFLAIRAEDSDGLVSRAWTLPRASPASSGGTATLHVLAVGTDRYDDPRLPNLAFAAADARNLAQGLAAAPSRYYATVETRLIENAPDLRERLPAELERIRLAAKPGDTVLVHVAGHGLLDGNGHFFLAGGGTRSADIAGTALAWSDVVSRLARFEARVIVLLDACHSGAADAATNDDAVDLLLETSKLPFAVLSASKGRQPSLESRQFGGGIFTATVLRALTSPDTDVDGNGTVELSELFATAKHDVVEATGGRQTPWLSRSRFVGEVPLF